MQLDMLSEIKVQKRQQALNISSYTCTNTIVAVARIVARRGETIFYEVLRDEGLPFLEKKGDDSLSIEFLSLMRLF